MFYNAQYAREALSWIFVMSFFSIGKNEIENLERQEKKLDSQLKNDSKMYSGNVLSFKAAILEKECKKIHNKIAILKHMMPENDADDDDIA